MPMVDITIMVVMVDTMVFVDMETFKRLKVIEIQLIVQIMIIS